MIKVASGMLVLLTLVACGPGQDETVSNGEPTALRVAQDIDARLARLAPTEMEVDLSGLPDSEIEALGHIMAAARLMDEIFLRQVSADNPALRDQVTSLPEAAQVYFDANFGPWDRLSENEPFIGDTPHPSGAGYYPTDMTAEEFESWLEAHPEDREAFEGLHTLIRRDGDDLVAVPYSEAFLEWLEPAASHLRKAAAATRNESLRHFLETRADAFSSGDYYDSDVAWMDLDAPVEVTIGPYEVYEDGLFGYKAAFEAFVTVDIPAESAALDRFKSRLPWLERNLPIPDEHKNFDRGTESPMRVVDEVFVGGDSKAGVQTLAFNLPNDERVREEKGSKKVMLRNMLRAKYEKMLIPIAARVLTPEDQERIGFDAFFAESLHHELSHGLGPGLIVVDGRETEVRKELKDLYSTMEEAKADVMGIYNILALAAEGEISEEVARTIEATYVAGLFRSARFGVHEAHGRGVISQFNHLLEQGALEIDEGGRFHAVSEVFPGAIETLLNEMLMLQALGDYEGTAAFLEKYGHPSEALLAAIDRLGDVPVDILPLYSGAEGL
jgi:hypothetical protein